MQTNHQRSNDLIAQIQTILAAHPQALEICGQLYEALLIERGCLMPQADPSTHALYIADHAIVTGKLQFVELLLHHTEAPNDSNFEE